MCIRFCVDVTSVSIGSKLADKCLSVAACGVTVKLTPAVEVVPSVRSSICISVKAHPQECHSTPQLDAVLAMMGGGVVRLEWDPGSEIENTPIIPEPVAV